MTPAASPFADHDPWVTTVDVPDVMWRSAGLLRSRERLQSATELLGAELHAAKAATLESPGDADTWRRFNLATVGWLVARAALRREESRGGHYRADFPQRDDLHWKVHLVDKVSTHGQEAG